MGFLHLSLHLIFSHMTQEIITTQQMPIPANSEKPVWPVLLLWLQCYCPSKDLATLQHSCHKDGLPAQLHQLCQPNHHLITLGEMTERVGGGEGRWVVRLKKERPSCEGEEVEIIRRESKNWGGGGGGWLNRKGKVMDFRGGGLQRSRNGYMRKNRQKDVVRFKKKWSKKWTEEQSWQRSVEWRVIVFEKSDSNEWWGEEGWESDL